MSWFHGLRHRLRTILDPGAHERELADEMRFHEELDTMQQRDSGTARRRFGNRTYYQEETRRMTWIGTLDVLRQDFGYAWRSVRRTPGFTAMVVVTLSLGLSANLATFSVLDRIFLRPPSGVEDPASLERVWFVSSALRSSTGKPQPGFVANYPMVRTTLAASSNPSALATFVTDFSLVLRRDAKKTKVRAVFASASYFPVLGVTPMLGRTYTAAEDAMGSPARVAVIGERFWERELGRDSSVLGHRLNIEYEDYVVIGVLPERFSGIDLQSADLWIPTAAIPAAHWLHQGRAKWWEGVNTWSFQVLRRGGTPDPGFEQRASIALRAQQKEHWPRNPDTLISLRVAGFGESLAQPGRERVIGSRLIGVSAIVLIIACANVINLLLARAVRRRREIAVRLALGISRSRLVRLLATETMLLALIAGGVALIGAWWGGTILRSMLMPNVQWYESVLHWRVMLFALAVTLLAGAVAGLIPALQSSRPDLTGALKEGAREGTAHRSRLRHGLVVVQAAFSVVLLVGAALFVRSLNKVRALDLGYDVDRIAFADVSFEKGQQVPNAVVASELIGLAERLAQRPGVDAVARAGIIPMQGIGFTSFYWGPGGVDSSQALKRNTPTMLPVSPEFFRAMGMRIVQGQTFDAGSGAGRQVVVNEATAALLWPGASPLGQCMRFEQRSNPCYTVVGVASNARQNRLIEEGGKPQLYLPLENMPFKWAGTALIVHARENALDAAMSETSAALRRAFPAGQVNVTTMAAELEPEYRPWTLGATLFTASGLLALLVAIVGIYSTVSYGVTQRMHEFGVRIALGARVGDVLRLVVGEGVRVVTIGVVIGVALALAAGRLIASVLYDVEAHDPIAMLVSGGILLLVAAVAALVPAWRASRVDPVTALRAD